MRSFTAVVGRELAERRLVWAAALALGFLPLLVQWAPWADMDTPGEVRDWSALLIAALFAAGAAVAVGASLVSRELADGRLGFYYVRPVGSFSLWCGKLAAALVLIATGVALVWLPSLVAGSRPWQTVLPAFDGPAPPRLPPPFLWHLDPRYQVAPRASAVDVEMIGGGSPWLAAAIGLLLLLLAAHGVAVIARTRGPWTLLDLIMLLVVAGLLISCLGRFVDHGAWPGAWTSLKVFLAVLLIAGFAAAWAQLGLGRTLAQRSHGVYSLVLWSVLLVAGAGLVAFSRLETRAEPADLESVVNLKAAPRGDWMVVAGPVGATGYAPAFAVHPADGRCHELAPLYHLDGPPVFSADGRVLAWIDCAAANPYRYRTVATPFMRWAEVLRFGCQVSWLDLEAEPVASAGSIAVPRGRHSVVSSDEMFADALTLSADGRRMALAQGSSLVVYELPAGRPSAAPKTVAAVRLPDPFPNAWLRLAFVTEDRIRVYLLSWSPPAPGLQVWELEVASQRLTRAGEIPRAWSFATAPGLDRLGVWRSFDRAIAVYDGRGEEKLFDLGTPPSVGFVKLRFLADGRIAAAENHLQQEVGLRIYSASGEEERQIAFPGSSRILVGGEPAAGRLLVGLLPGDGFRGKRRSRLGGFRQSLFAWETRLLDLESGETIWTRPGAFPGWQPAEPGSPASRVVLGERGPGRLDVATGTVHPLLVLASG